MRSKFLVFCTMAASVVMADTAKSPNAREQYTATVQLMIDEPTPQLLKRSQQIAVQELENTFKSRRELELSSYDLQISPSGNLVLLTVASEQDIQLPVQNALSSVISGIDRKVWARGRADLFRTNFTQPVEAALEIELADIAMPVNAAPGSQTESENSMEKIRIQRMVVSNFPVKDVIHTLKAHISRDKGQTPFGHSMDRSCLQRYVDFSFNEYNDKEPKTLDKVLEDLADSLNIKFKNKDGFYVFQGACPLVQEPRTPTNMPNPFQTVPGLNQDPELNNAAFRPMNGMGQHFNVHIPLMPLGRW
ncbi:MAG: hypothetical protein KDD39_11580 [Bdellovibrionales bacterium]|nr:hypothetical protein [Bdellovibrionales bacterium]